MFCLQPWEYSGDSCIQGGDAIRKAELMSAEASNYLL
jgi:hypothetical protein